ncbi:MAG: OmpA/MotB family protein, partial [Bryobacteraceae bacterium]
APPPPPAPAAELIPSMTVLKEQLKLEIEKGMLQVTMESRGLVVSLRQAAFFAPGRDEIEASTFPTIEKLAAVIVKLPNRMRLEGHTDSVPIRTDRYRSNWDLSAARGVAMLELLSARYQIPQSRLSVAGYAETIPVDSNDTVEGRARNRRVDVVILNEKGLSGEPAPATGTQSSGSHPPPAKKPH